MTRLFGFLAFIWILLSVALPAEARPSWLIRSGTSSSNYVIPGVLAPYPGGATWNSCATLSNCPGPQGSSFATLSTPAVFDAVPGNVVAGTVPLCVFAQAHTTSGTIGGGNLQGIARVDFQVNGGPTISVTNSTTASPSSEPEYCTKLRTSDLGYDGQFKVWAIVYPVDGLPQVLQTADGPSCSDGCELNLIGNSGGGYSWTGYIVHVNQSLGADTVGCGTNINSSACASPCYAIGQLHTNSTSNAPIAGDLSGGIIALAPGTYSTTISCGTSYATSIGNLTVEADTSAGGNQSNVILANNGNPCGFRVQTLRLYDLTLSIQGVNGFNSCWGSTSQGILDTVNFIGWGKQTAQLGPWQPGTRWGRLFETDSTLSNSGFAASGVYFARNLHVTQIGSDAFNNTVNELNVRVDNVSPMYLGTATISPLSTTVTMTTTADMVAGGSIFALTSGCMGTFSSAYTISSVTDATHIVVNSLPTGNCTSGVETSAHPDTNQIQNPPPAHVIWAGYHTDGSLLVAGTVDAQGTPWCQGSPVVTCNNFAFYDVNSFISNNGRTNFQPFSPWDNWTLINSSWGGGAFNTVHGTPTNVEFIDATCEAVHPGGIGTFAGVTYYLDPTTNKCH